MTKQLKEVTQAERSSTEPLVWWQALSDDDRDLLRVTHSLLPNEPYLLALLASTDCPLVYPTGDHARPYEMSEPEQLHAILSQR